MAVSQGIVSGYPDGTFKPNKNVTRAEMAALLDRTNDGLLQNQGAVSISGTVKEIQFTTDAADNFNNQSNGQIKIETWNKELLSYGISSKLPVKHNKKFILADQIAVNNPMRLIVKDGQVVEAELLSTKEVSKDGTSKKEPNQEKKPNQEQKAGAIAEFDFEVELAGKEKIKLEYKNKKGTAQAQVEKESKKDKEKLKGNQAVQYMEELIAKAGLTDSMSGNEAVDKLMAALNIDKGQVKELELEVKFSSGKQMKIEIENDDDHDDDDED
ncbi:hypothetical protein D3C77_356590 [compost metagenome]